MYELPGLDVVAYKLLDRGALNELPILTDVLQELIDPLENDSDTKVLSSVKDAENCP